ncbi:hypothetical protein IQ276_027695 [Desmonostoc muscorum LEGE 12446]|uniref:Uncharacterized protein n=1 Tax=Desmonostoc muscorum LEGE 12446 TaxID=1828758 RepID=A0A8J6ZWT5_DESMC|nr:hypothetical protein [Desmonostoc muscorum]MCF2150149.1 hypothetical protein [Desmonostoc muscorum LEGE 12446]
MAYDEFTLGKVKSAFGIATREGDRFLPEIEPISPSSNLQESLKENLPLAVATGSEKARSELIISPVLVEARRILERKISLFSGQDFTVDATVGLDGRCDFLISRFPELLEIEAPTVVIVEAKKGDLNAGIGQCIAEMIAAQRFNHLKENPTQAIYGSITNGTQWRFLRLVEQIVEIDLTDYPLPPIDQILGFFVWMVRNA